MGCRGVMSALGRLDNMTSVVLQNIILTSPDIDADLLRSSIARMKMPSRISVYSRPKDLALRMSQSFAGFSRAGTTTSPIPGADVIIDRSDQAAWSFPFLNDISSLIRQGLPPEKRFGLKEVRIQPAGGTVWELEGADDILSHSLLK